MIKHYFKYTLRSCCLWQFVVGVVAPSAFAPQARDCIEIAGALPLCTDHVGKHHSWIGATATAKFGSHP